MNLLAWQNLDCIHKDVCFHNGIKCGEFVCKDLKPMSSIPERLCVITPTSFSSGRCSNCGEELTIYEGFNPFEHVYEGNYCIECGAKVIGSSKYEQGASSAEVVE